LAAWLTEGVLMAKGKNLNSTGRRTRRVSAHQLASLIEEAQKQPGIEQALLVVEQAQAALQAVREVAQATAYAGGASAGTTLVC
jgi:hypothetical protein